jgi:transcriptional accessory protein Tex/SPT6
MISPGTKTIRDLAVGELVTGSVQRLTSYGAFVDIGMERDAMLHVKEMGDGYVAKPEDVVKVGDEIEARISGVDARRGRVDLSLKGLRPAASSSSASEDIEIQPIGAVDEADEELPTLMELAFRQALDGEEDFQPPSRGRKPKRRKGRDRYEQDDIISRTLRYRG